MTHNIPTHLHVTTKHFINHIIKNLTTNIKYANREIIKMKGDV